MTVGYVPPIPSPVGVDTDAWDAAIAAIRAFCEWHIAPVVTDSQSVLVHGSTVTLRSLRVAEVTGVTVAGVAVEPDGWVLSPESPTLFLRSGVCRPLWCPDVSVVASVDLAHGFDEFPPELLAIAQEAASRGTEGSFVGQVGQVRFSAGVAGTPGAASFMLGQSAAMLARYKLPPRP